MRSGGFQVTIPQVKLTVTEGGKGRVVRDGYECSSILSGKAQKQFDDSCSRHRVEIPRGFVGKKNAGIIHQGAGNRHTLLLSTAELRGKMVEAS